MPKLIKNSNPPGKITVINYNQTFFSVKLFHPWNDKLEGYLCTYYIRLDSLNRCLNNNIICPPENFVYKKSMLWYIDLLSDMFAAVELILVLHLFGAGAALCRKCFRHIVSDSYELIFTRHHLFPRSWKLCISTQFFTGILKNEQNILTVTKKIQKRVPSYFKF